MKKQIIGLDVSKLTLDAWLHGKQLHKKFPNNQKGFIQLFKWAMQKIENSQEELAFCFEHTGMYSQSLSIFLHEKNACFYLVSGLTVKRSLGLVRGKNDKVDAKNLARFAMLHQAELQPYQLPSEKVLRLKQLLSFREKLVRQRSAHKSYLKEVKTILFQNDSLTAMTEELIHSLTEKIKMVEKEMVALIGSDEALLKTERHITGIKGVGLILAAAMIASTNNFHCFESWRKFACYAGIAPFEHQSGTSYRGKTKVSSLGNRQLKTLLNQAALTAIQFNAEMKQYYERRLREGKSKMSTINIVRNKLVSRMFAVAKRQTPFVDVYKFAA